MSEELDILLAKQACTELVYRLARGLDRCDRAMLMSVFHPDATDDHGIFKGTAADFIDWVVGVLPTMERTQHMIGNVLIDVDGDRAVGEAYFIANHDIVNAAGEPARMIAAGRYLDRFERRAGVWKISHRHAVYDWNANLDRTDTWDRTPASPRVFGQNGDGDPIYAHRAMLKL